MLVEPKMYSWSLCRCIQMQIYIRLFFFRRIIQLLREELYSRALSRTFPYSVNATNLPCYCGQLHSNHLIYLGMISWSAHRAPNQNESLHLQRQNTSATVILQPDTYGVMPESTNNIWNLDGSIHLLNWWCMWLFPGCVDGIRLPVWGLISISPIPRTPQIG